MPRCGHCSMDLSSSEPSIDSYDLKGASTISVLQALLLVFKSQQPQVGQGLSQHQLRLEQSVKLCSSCGALFRTLLYFYLDFMENAAEDSFVNQFLGSERRLLRSITAEGEDGELLLSFDDVNCILENLKTEPFADVKSLQPSSLHSSSSISRTRYRNTRSITKIGCDTAKAEKFNVSADESDSNMSANDNESDVSSDELNVRDGESDVSADESNFSADADDGHCGNKKAVASKVNVAKSTRGPGRPRKEANAAEALNFPCNVCNEAFRSQTRLKMHHATHTGSRPYKCDHVDCPMSFATKAYLQKHIKKCHLEGSHKYYQRKNGAKERKQPLNMDSAELLETDQFKCEDCASKNVWFSDLKRWVEHRESQHGESLGYGSLDLQEKLVAVDGLYRPCPHCGKKYKANSRLLGHIKFVHLDMDQFQCPQCPKALMTKVSLLQHIDSVHPEVEKPRSFLCSLCAASFNSKYNLVSHERTHLNFNGVEKRFRCEQCDKKYAKRADLIRHVASAHSEARNFVCDICGSAFKLIRNLNQHKQVVHLKKGIVDQFCSFCDKGYAFKGALKHHLMAKHDLSKEEARVKAGMKAPTIFRVLPNGDRVFKEKPTKLHTVCHICNKAYVRREQVYLHLMSIHGHSADEARAVTGFETKPCDQRTKGEEDVKETKSHVKFTDLNTDQLVLTQLIT